MKKMFLLLSLTILISFAGCQSASEGYIITKYPDRLIYIAGYDTELDLTGGEVEMLLRDFWVKYSEIKPMDVWFLSDIYKHEIDFDVPGVYVVTLNHYMRSDRFAIQVVEADYIENLLK